MTFFVIITIVFTACYVFLIAYYFIGWMNLKEYKPEDKILSTKISVIIPCRNEEENILNLLQDLKDQLYTESLYEIIVVDDHSTDNIMQAIKTINIANVRYVRLPDIPDKNMNKPSGKKAAITYGIEQSSGELIVTTDADCHVGHHWLRTIAAYYEEHKPVMIAGMVSYFYDSSFLGKFQTLDFLSLVGIAAASIQNGFYNLCNGANLAYTKKAFYEVEGFKNIDHIPTGDDMLLMHKMAAQFPHKIATLKSKDAMVLTHTIKDFSSFWQQRTRWTSKATHYEDKRITGILVFAYSFNALLVCNLLAGLFSSEFLKIAMFQFLAKICVDTVFIYSVAKFFRKENLLWLFLPMQALHTIYILAIAPAGVFGKYSWKGRIIKK